MTTVPFLDVKATDFSIRSEIVMAAREKHWFAKTPYGVAILRYEDANALQNDKRLHQGTRRWPEHNGIESELLVPTTTVVPPVLTLVVNLFRLNPYVGVVFADPSVLNPTSDLSCQYFKTPVFWS